MRAQTWAAAFGATFGDPAARAEQAATLYGPAAGDDVRAWDGMGAIRDRHFAALQARG